MKTIITVIIIFLLSTLLYAGDEETIIGEHYHSGGYGGPVWKFSSINDQNTFLSGGRGGWIINHMFAIGGGGYSLLSDFEIKDFEDTDQTIEGKPLYMEMHYGGFELEFINDSDRLYHWTIHTLIGGGNAKISQHEPLRKIESGKFFVIEPSFNIDFNINKWFRVGVGASYRLVSGLDMNFIADKDLSELNGLIILKFGSF